MQASWPIDKRKEILEQHLASLRTRSPAKHKVASKLHSISGSSENVYPSAPEKQSCPLLATCFGNRSAALYELGQTKVMLYLREHGGPPFFIQRIGNLESFPLLSSHQALLTFAISLYYFTI